MNLLLQMPMLAVPAKPSGPESRPPPGLPPEEHPEFSDIGRDPHFSPGWWLPVAVAVVVVALIVLI